MCDFASSLCSRKRLSLFFGNFVCVCKPFVHQKKLRIRSNVYCKSCWSNFQFFIAALQALYHQGTTSGVKMAYVPPHKRHLKETERPLLTPELFAPQFKKNLNVKPSEFDVETSSKSFLYANHALSRFYTVGLDDQNQFPSTVKLEPISLDSTYWNNEENL
ncbi:uncharacterized protein [Malus domestica]|uniref:uncharacterized protein isoform X3 n=1 Tax=Malus domestica TaxID=3750 RepID=UPI00049929B1